MVNIEGKKITVLGAVRSGLGAAKLAKAMGAIPFVSDISLEQDLEESLLILNESGIAFEHSGHTEKVSDCDFMITSPGVPSTSPVLVEAKKKGIKVISELEFAFWFCKGAIIGITGTNGKTTTTSLLAHVINQSGRKCFLAGNVGVAFSEVVLDVKEEDYVALEISSFQLDHIECFKPAISMILNITPDHLDRYENDYNKYKLAKTKIAANQNGSDKFVYNVDDREIPITIINDMVEKYQFSTKFKLDKGSYLLDNNFYFNNEKVCSTSDLTIMGEHNFANALAVLNAVKLNGLSNEEIKKGFSTFVAVEHRMEMVRVHNDVEYINDSKATNVDSVWYALRSYDKPIYLILGGKDKGNDYNKIKQLVAARVMKIYAIGSSADQVYNFFNKIVDVEKLETLEDTVNKARNEAKKNTVVLLSPACASFDMFKSYEHRGKVFKEAVRNLN